MSQRRAFTLIELMVVMGIIAVLMGLLLPVMSKVHMQTSQTNCLSNLKQITTACLAYAMENEGQLPYCNWGEPTNTGVYGRGWMYTTSPFRPAWTGANYPVNGVTTGVIYPYINTVKVYHCPLDQPEFWTGTNFMASYLCNGAQCGYGVEGEGNNINVPGYKLGAFTTPADSVYFWEAMEQTYEGQSLTGAVWNDGASYPYEEVLADRHFKGANVSCFDGHVEWWDPHTWAVNVNASGHSRLWCAPLAADPSGNGR